MQIIDGIPVFGAADEKALAQARGVREQALHVALMGDHHLGYVMPIGGVAAYDNAVSVTGVGFDIACGNCAIKTDLTWTLHPVIAEEFADEIANTLSFGIGRKNTSNDAPVDHPLFDDPAWFRIPVTHRAALHEKARTQLGTIGSGNHYVDVFHDETGAIWVGVHFGSRGFGHTVASGFLALGAGEAWGTRVPEQETLLALDTQLGDDYWALMELAGQYAYAGREWVARTVVGLLGGMVEEIVHNHHNYGWRETHEIDGEMREVIVVRKGATPAFPMQKGFVGGSMGDDAVILMGESVAPFLTGIEPYASTTARQQAALFSTVHGAGRVLSRSQAAGSRPKFNKQTGERRQARAGQITRQMMSDWTREKGVVVRGGGVDESPHCYRRLPEVLAAQGDTIQVLHTLTPKIVVMAGADVKDPFRD